MVKEPLWELSPPAAEMIPLFLESPHPANIAVHTAAHKAEDNNFFVFFIILFLS